MQMQSDNIEIETTEDGHVGTLTVRVEGEIKSEVMERLVRVQRVIEQSDGVDRVVIPRGRDDTTHAGEWAKPPSGDAPGGDGLTVEPDPPEGSVYEEVEEVRAESEGKGGGVKGMRFRYPDEDATVIEGDDDGIISIKPPKSDTHSLIRPTNKAYWVLWHFAHYQHTVGEPATNADLTDHYSHLGDVTGTTPNLRRSALVEAVAEDGVEDPLYGAAYRVTDAGEKYLRRHGEPEGFPLPEDGLE